MDDIYLTVQQVADCTSMKRQGVHYHIKNGNFGEPFYGLVPPGRQLNNNAATGRPATIWLKLDSVLGYYQKKSDIFQLGNILRDFD